MESRAAPGLVQALVDISGRENVLDDPAQIEDYSRDMADYEAYPAVVVKPRSEREVALVVDLAGRLKVPIVPRGAGSSLTGASVLEGAIIIDMREMSRILKVDTVNWFVQVQPGISLEDLNKELKGYGFFFPPDPSSSYICTVGGAIAEGSGGLRCVKYGTMKDWVVSVRVVLPNGKVARFGEPLAKNRAGFDLMHLLVGSEGTLGVITEAHLKIIPIPVSKVNRFLLTFADWDSVSSVIKDLRSSRIMPDLFEFLDRENISALNEKLGMSLEEADATILVDIEDAKVNEARRVFERCGARSMTLAKNEEEAEMFYRIRTMAYLATKNLASGVHVEDIVVPIERLGDYLASVRRIAAKYSMRILVNGHAGDGNVHPVILYEKSDARSAEAAEEVVEELCRSAISMGGSITGEHGVGIQKTKFLREQLTAHEGEEALRLMKGIKQLFDPDGIMNPGKYVQAA